MAFRKDDLDKVLLQYFRASPQGNYTEIDLIGVNLVNPKGRVDLSTIFRYFTIVRQIAYRSNEFCFQHARNESDTYFILHCTLDIRSSLYRKVLIKGVWLKARYSMELLGLGNSTLLFHLKMRDLEDGEVLATSYVKMVIVNVITRRSSSFSDSFLKEYAQFANKGNSLLPTYRPHRAPDNVFRHQFIIYPADTDSNGHTGNHVYTRLCLDCAHLASENSFFKKFSADFNQPKRVEQFFAKECGENDVVDVLVWEDSEVTELLHFHLTKATTLLYCIDIEFYRPEIMKSKL